MPFVHIRVTSGMTPERKAQLIERVTAAVVEVLLDHEAAIVIELLALR